MVLWKVARRVEGSRHDHKYGLFYGYAGRKLVGYDNERGKGDHRHLDGDEQTYEFSTVEKRIADFLQDAHVRRQGSI